MLKISLLVILCLFLISAEDYCRLDDISCSPSLTHLPTPSSQLSSPSSTVLLTDGRRVNYRRLSTSPFVFAVQSFTTVSQLRAFRDAIRRTPLKRHWSNVAAMESGRVVVIDEDKDGFIGVDEMRATIAANFDVHLERRHVLKMYDRLGWMPDADGYLTGDQIVEGQGTTNNLRRYIAKIAEKHTKVRGRNFESGPIDMRANDELKSVLLNLEHLLELPTALMNKSDIHMLRYNTSTQYVSHYDSTPTSPTPCCNKYIRGRVCRQCRFVTAILALNEGDGGQIALPFADKFNHTLLYNTNLHYHCNDSALLVRPRATNLVVIYNHVDGPEWLSDMDKNAVNGICPVGQGTKWEVRFWIRVTEDREFDLASTYDEKN